MLAVGADDFFCIFEATKISLMKLQKVEFTRNELRGKKKERTKNTNEAHLGPQKRNPPEYIYARTHT